MPVAWVIHILNPTAPLLNGNLNPDLFHLLRVPGYSETFRKGCDRNILQNNGYIIHMASDKVGTAHRISQPLVFHCTEHKLYQRHRERLREPTALKNPGGQGPSET